MAAEEGQLVREAADEGGRAGEDAVVAMRSARGRKRKQGWQSVGSEEMLASENLRQAAQRWLKQHHILHETLQRSSDAGVRTLLAKCGECQSCTRQWCFRQSGSELRVERVGECTEGDKRVDRIRRRNARQFSQDSPLRALKKMRSAGIPLAQRPTCRPLFQTKD